VKNKSEESKFLEGPQSRWKELTFILKVLLEFIKSFRVFHFLGPCVTVFGSARFGEDHPSYHMCRQMGKRLAELGFTIMTGGGPGIMEAANRGAKDANGRSIGCNIILTHEQKQNAYLDYWVDIDYFFVRKVILSKYSYAFVVFPGGYGTMDEFFEAITLVQTNKIKRFPIVVFGKKYYELLYAQLIIMKNESAIGEKDLDLFLFTDHVEEAIAYISKFAIDQFDLRTKKKRWKPMMWLGEKLKFSQ
jgi:uncharacterized protein (TIGR00730 family)